MNVFKIVRKVGGAMTLALLATSISAAPISIMIGDNDGYGQGVLDGANLPSLGFTDYRDSSEVTATNGAEQTDIYSAAFTPVEFAFDVVFDVSVDLVSAFLTVDMGGFQATTYGALDVEVNGTSVDWFDVEDGAFATVVRTFDLAPFLGSINSSDQLLLTFDRANSTDAIAFDYFRLDGTTAAVPEPAPLALISIGLLAVGASRRKFR